MSDSGISLALPQGSVDFNALHDLLKKKNVTQSDVDGFLNPQVTVESAAEPAPSGLAAEPALSETKE